jgi:predicted restriction endonuclease
MSRDFNNPIYKEWRLRVLKRDGYKCRMPGCKCKRRLQVHHIKKWSSASMLRYDVDNGISLCFICHKSIKNREIYYEQLFTNIVRNT